MRSNRPRLQVLALALLTGGLIALAALASMSGCSPTAVELAQKTQTAVDLAQRSAQDGFAKWDRAHQQAVLDADLASGRPVGPDIAAYRREREKAVGAFAALAAASHAVAAALEASGSAADLGTVLGRLYATVDRLREALAGLGFSWAPLDALLGGG